MVSVLSLWLAILLSAFLVFIVSSILHMVLPWHRKDWIGVPNEDEVRDAMRKLEIPPGDYMLPHHGSAKGMNDPEFLARFDEGPVALMTVLPNKRLSMTGPLAQWFVYCLIVGLFAAYIAGSALGPGAHYLSVFRFVGCVAFVGYGMALLQNSIWYKRKWSTTLKSVIDALVYGLVTAGVFGWLWPN